MPKCDQCENKARYEYEDGSRLCVDHALKAEEIADREFARNASELNMLADHMEAISGVSGAVARYEIPKPTVVSGSIVHNIKVDNSVIGAINTGQIENMNVALEHVHVGGNRELADALQLLTEAVLASSELSKDKKAAAVEHLSHIADQAALPQEKRQVAISRTILEGFERIIGTSSSLLTMWQAIKPHLAQLF